MSDTILDRFEADYAVCETEDGLIRLSRDLLPSDAAEGDLLCLSSDGCWTIDKAATAARREAMLAKRRRRAQQNDN